MSTASKTVQEKRFLFLFAWVRPGKPARVYGSGALIENAYQLLELSQSGDPDVYAWVFFADTKEDAQALGLEQSTTKHTRGRDDSIAYCMELSDDTKMYPVGTCLS